MRERYARRGDKQTIAEVFHVKAVPDFATPMLITKLHRLPFSLASAIAKPRRARDGAWWGLIPFFTKELSDIKGVSLQSTRRQRRLQRRGPGVSPSRKTLPCAGVCVL